MRKKLVQRPLGQTNYCETPICGDLFISIESYTNSQTETLRNPTALKPNETSNHNKKSQYDIQ